MTVSIENNLKSENEKIQSKYGFCYMCLKPANFYCIYTGIGVCSSECKKEHINYITNNPVLDFQYNESFRNEVEKLLFNNLKAKKSVPLSI
jgi:formylmethanofuran dehydrogenase subunit B